MTQRIRLPLEVTLRSPFMMQGLRRVALGVDASVLRDGDGRPVIPADHIKGLLRQAFWELVEAGVAHAGPGEFAVLFGQESPQAHEGEEQNVPDRAHLIFSDLTAVEAEDNGAADTRGRAPTFTRVQIDDETGSARSGHLQVIELAAPLGAEVTFRGEVTALCPPLEASKLKEDLQRALELVPAVGGFRSAGFGEVVAERSRFGDPDEQKLLPETAGPAGAAPAEVQRFLMTFDRPVLVDARRLADNYFEGATVVPGGAIKGALARRLELAGRLDDTLSRTLSQLVVGHAYPLSNDGRRLDMPLPESLVASQDHEGTELRFADALVHGEAKGVLLDGRVPVFQTDWKDGWEEEFRRREELPGRSGLAKHVRTRTRIDPATGVAMEHALFSFAAVETRETAWAFDICRNGIPEADFEFLCSALEAGLDGLGKTDAHADLRRERAEQPKSEPVAADKPDLWAVTLLTPALLTDPGSEASLRDQYADYWQSALGSGATLRNFFARIRLAGGYQALRHRPFGKQYYPFVLTEAGSAFLLEGELGEALGRIARSGLPVAHMSGAGAIGWRTCPFVPENGYGAIATNAVDHVRLAEGLRDVV